MNITRAAIPIICSVCLLSLNACSPRADTMAVTQVSRDRSVAKVISAKAYTSDVSPKWPGIEVVTQFDPQDVTENFERTLQLDVTLGGNVRKDFEVFRAELYKGGDLSKQQPFYENNKPKKVDARFLFLGLKPGDYQIRFIMRGLYEDIDSKRMKTTLAELRTSSADAFRVSHVTAER